MGQNVPIGYDRWYEYFGRDAGIPYNPPIEATGGSIVRFNGHLKFFLDEDSRDKIESILGERPPEWIKTEVKFCNPTPGTMPALGDFRDPETGLVCFVDLPEGWGMAWMKGTIDSNLEKYDFEWDRSRKPYEP